MTKNTKQSASLPSAKTQRVAAAKAKAPLPNAPRHRSKISQVIAFLERKEGATLADMTSATGWQPHSARAALTGLKKKGHVIVKSKRGDATCYRIAVPN